jgi:anti-sigma factor RsiW
MAVPDRLPLFDLSAARFVMPDPITIQCLRLHVDGELPADESARVERAGRHDPALAGRIEAERQLRRRIGHVMQAAGESAPADLAARIRVAMLAESLGPSLAAEPLGAPGRRGPARGGPGAFRLRDWLAIRDWLAAPQRINVFAVAACLMLVAGAVLIGIFGQPIDRMRAGAQAQAMPVELLEFVRNEHRRCACDAAATEKFILRSLDEASRGLSHYFSADVQVPDLRAVGYDFVGGSACHLPNCDRSGHVMYRSQGPTDARLSIFMEPYTGQFDCGADRLPVASGLCEHRMWCDGRMVYIMTACKSDELPAVFARIQDTIQGTLRGERRPAIR